MKEYIRRGGAGGKGDGVSQDHHLHTGFRGRNQHPGGGLELRYEKEL